MCVFPFSVMPLWRTLNDELDLRAKNFSEKHCRWFVPSVTFETFNLIVLFTSGKWSLFVQ